MRITRCFLLLVFLLSDIFYFVLAIPIKAIEIHGGGIYFWWQAGAATYLNQHCPLGNDIEFVGASAGSITAALLLARANFTEAAEVAINEVAKLNLWEGSESLFGVWGDIVHNFLHRLLSPVTFHDRDLRRIHIALTYGFIFAGTTHVSDFNSKEELLHAVLTSTHIPFFMNGEGWRKYREGFYIDGSFWYFVLKLTPPLPTSLLQRLPNTRHTPPLINTHTNTNTCEKNNHTNDRVKEDVCDEIIDSESEVTSSSSSSYPMSSSSYSLFSSMYSVFSSFIFSFFASPSSTARTSSHLSVLTIDYLRDEALLKYARNLHFAKLVTPEMVYEMMELGYDYMKREYERGALSPHFCTSQ